MELETTLRKVAEETHYKSEHVLKLKQENNKTLEKPHKHEEVLNVIVNN